MGGVGGGLGWGGGVGLGGGVRVDVNEIKVFVRIQKKILFFLGGGRGGGGRGSGGGRIGWVGGLGWMLTQCWG